MNRAPVGWYTHSETSRLPVDMKAGRTVSRVLYLAGKGEGACTRTLAEGTRLTNRRTGLEDDAWDAERGNPDMSFRRGRPLYADLEDLAPVELVVEDRQNIGEVGCAFPDLASDSRLPTRKLLAVRFLYHGRLGLGLLRSRQR